MIKKYKNNLFLVKLSESFLGVGLDKILGLMLPFVAVKLYGASIYGEYTYYFAIAMILSIFSKIGLDTGLIYYIPRLGNKCISSSFFIVGLLSTIVGSTYLLIERTFLGYVPLFIFISVHALFLAIHRATGKIKEYYIVSSFIRYGVAIILLFFMSNFEFDQGIIIAVTSGYLIADFVLIYYNREKFKKLEFSKELVLYSLPLMITSAMALIMNQIDVIMLKQYVDVSTVGVYNIAAKLATLPAYLLTIFNTVFAPKISQLYHNKKYDELNKLYTISTRILMVVSLVMVVFIVISNKFILSFFGEEFLFAGNVILYRGIGQVVNSSVGSVWLMLSMTGRSKLNMIGTSSAAIINIIINFILIPRMGMDGAAIASMIAVSFVNILGYVLVKKCFNVKVFGIF